jgi:ectoine hydroxylase-related dioxygenase (phytanoyl-CoA dioxygenase family)
MFDEETLAKHTTRVERDGYTIVEDAIEPEFVDALVAALERLEQSLDVKPAGNPFEGSRTIRIYNLLAHEGPFVRIPVHANVLPVVESVLDPGCLVSSLSSISICPGETAQPIHADDQLIPIPRPHPPLVCNTMWALTDFTEENGATRIVPGSHRYDRAPIFGQSYESVAAVMRRGSVMVYNGSLWHGGGENRTQARRVGVAMNYCAGYIRQQENQQLGIPREVVRRFPPRLQELVGYGLYNGLIGHIDKKPPMSLIGARDEQKLIWGS